MTETYTEEALQQIAEDLVENLRECPDGYTTTTAALMRDAGYNLDEIDDMDLMRIDYLMRGLSSKNHIKLDDSAHKGKCVGLPFNLDFVVHNRRAQIRCPHCGCDISARYIYGYPALTDSMREKLENGTLVLGGCEIEAIDSAPRRLCDGCGRGYASMPLLINKEKGTVEDYRDIVTGITFTVGGFFGGYTTTIVRKTGKGATVKVEKPALIENNTSEKHISAARWRSIVEKLYCGMFLHEWKKSYEDPSILDGTQWDLEITLTGNRKRSYHGSNAYPAYRKELLRLFRGLVKGMSNSRHSNI